MSRVRGHSDFFGMDMLLDLNVDIYPVKVRPPSRGLRASAPACYSRSANQCSRAQPGPGAGGAVALGRGAGPCGQCCARFTRPLFGSPTNIADCSIGQLAKRCV